MRASGKHYRHGTYGHPSAPRDGDAMNCDDIGNQVVQAWDLIWDPYNLDVLYGSGNCWSCDGIG